MRERNKPTKTWLEKAREELANEKELTIERAYELGRIRGIKDTIDKACKFWYKLTEEGSKYHIGYPVTKGWINEFRKAMEVKMGIVCFRQK